ncbi:C2 domain-containing protein [Lactarius psammicola]|nr:C2 domain-containing protein [Lactarius psammicola]
MVSANTVTKPSRTTQHILSRGSRGDSSSSGETPIVILRVQVLSCQNLESKDRNGFSDPFVTVTVLGKRFQTPVYNRSLNPVYEPKYATFDFPIYTSTMHKLGALEFVVWDKDMIGKDFLGKYALPVNQWFRGTAFAFDDRNNQPFFVDLVSSRPNTTVRGAMRIKVGFVHPPNLTGLPDFGTIYNLLMNPVLAPPAAGNDRVGIVLLEIYGAKNLPEWPNGPRTGWDMDPFVQVSIGEQVKLTKVIRHSLNPVWNEEILFHVRECDLRLPIQLMVFDHDKFTFHDFVGATQINITKLVAKKDPITEFYPVDLPTIHEFNLPLTKNPKKKYTCNPTIEFRASYQTSVALQK